MLKFTPILLAVLYAVAMYRFSAWRTARELDARSTELADPVLKVLTDRMAAALDIPRISVNIYEIDPVNGLAAPDGEGDVLESGDRLLRVEAAAQKAAS